ncbi:hypothetical protein MVEN_01138400 [Mycena venus]|uniref:PHD-type domain-containing protein n=1 Tax=Mycena venus TaxID=2733690 RepID=A0A8H7D0C0_9AGAR|nr:hypothetical protein MVEN_01138400 [Mycena venus]
MFQRIKRFFGLGKTPQPPDQQFYPPTNIYGPPTGPPYFSQPYGQVPWSYPMYPGGPSAGNHYAGYPLHSAFQSPWGTQTPAPGMPQGPFPSVYYPPPYPLPQMYPMPPATNPQATSSSPNIGYGSQFPVQTAAAQPLVVTQESISCQWPDGNIKVECTTGQEPPGWDDQGRMWRSSGPRKQGLPAGSFKVDKRVCLGVFHCSCSSDDGLPVRFFRPKKDKTAREKQHSETCHICHSTLRYVSCNASLTYYRYTDDNGVEHSVRQHHGRHEHGRPPLKVLPAADRAALDQQVRENPSLTAQQLRAGAGPTQVALGDISPILLGARKARSEVEKSKVRQGIVAPSGTRNSGFQLLNQISTLKDAFETPWIVKSDLMDGRFIVMQTPFMRDILLQDQVRSWHEENLEAESGRHGLVTDGCHDFFKEGILLTSLVFSQVIMRWAPILFTWIGHFDEKHHKSHFDQLVYVIAELRTRGLGYAFDERLYSAVLDFSSTQRNGFISAFVEYMCSRIPGWNTLSAESRSTEAAALRARAEALIKGCIVHWKRSLHKIKQIIGKKHLFRFEGLIGVLESEQTTAAEFLQAVEQIRAEFPEVRAWLAWWILPGNGSMIFPVMQKMPAELRAKLPNSTNASDSTHWLLYRAVGVKFDLWEGIRRLYRFQRETEMLYAAIIAGHVDARFQGTKPQPKSRINWHENDGRAPDTRERLAAIERIEGDFTALNLALTDAERFNACNSAPVFPSAPPAPAPSSTPPTMLMRQSYIWDANSCFIDAPLEAYFRVFIAMGDAVRAEFLRRIRVEARNTGLRDVFEHMWLRGLLSGSIVAPNSTVTKPSEPKLKHALLAGQLNVKRLIATKWDGCGYSAGMASCARTWVNQMSTMETTRGVQKYFGVSYTVNRSCGSKHSTTQSHPWITVEHGVHKGDFFVAGREYIRDSSCQLSLQEYLIHAVPRERLGTSCLTWPPLHLQPAIACPHPSCKALDAAVTSISTEWPLILRIDPILRARGTSFDPTMPDLHCPLTMQLGDGVEYTLIARVIYLGPPNPGSVGHYITKTRLRDGTYLYNDCRRGGLLTELGPLHLLEDHDAQTCYVLYLRTSKASITSRTVAEIQQDFAKIPEQPNEIIPIMDSDDELDQMLIESITLRSENGPLASPVGSPDRFFTPEQSPAPSAPYDISDALADISHETKSATPSPVFCEPCGANLPEGDDDPDEVQCEKCKLWSHFKCYPGVDWNNSSERFFCRGCRDEMAAEFFQPGQVVMLPSPEPGDWKAPHVLWYPAEFIQHHKQRKGKFNEYEFRWSNCNDGTVFHSSLSDLPVLMLRTHFRGRKFLEEIQDVTLTAEMIGTIRLPFYMKPDDPGHQNPTLTAIFDAAIPQVAGILAAWDDQHPVVASYNEYFAGKKKHLQSREAPNWMDIIGLVSTPELEAVLTDPLISLMDHPALLNLTEEECQTRVMGVGSVLLQFLAVQHELGEPLNLNGDLVEDLKDESVIACLPDGDKALNAMFSAIPSTSTRSGVLVRQMLASKRDHIIFDEEFRPPFFQRDRPSHFPPAAPIPVKVQGAVKRKRDDHVEDEKPAKRAKPGSKKGRKDGGNDAPKRKRDDEIDPGKSPKRTRITRKKEGKSGGKSSTQKSALTTRSRRHRGEN